MKSSLALFSLLTAAAFGHGGGLDDNGRHFNRSTGQYHCHREPCLSQKNQSKITKQLEETIPDTGDTACSDVLPFGRPEAATTLLCRTGYALGFDCKKRSALWVSYIVTSAIHNTANVPRSDDYRADPDLPKNCRKELHDFPSGYDRGHLVSSATLDANVRMNSETFLLSNISPQLPKFNGAIWRGLENRERKWSDERGSLYVIAGPIFTNEQLDIRIPIPSYFYKIIFDSKRNIAASFLIPHTAAYTAELESYRASIDQIEVMSGIDFFNGLDDEIEFELERKVYTF